ncbi:hypothetical protein V1478_003636 [Vespula squamosa]|uniref:Uncharacterized protein n=1 Tax=Vespula squamosa TaxID=30214 RepID=A0ABD2BNM2_VESSQ
MEMIKAQHSCERKKTKEFCKDRILTTTTTTTTTMAILLVGASLRIGRGKSTVKEVRPENLETAILRRRGVAMRMVSLRTRKEAWTFITTETCVFHFTLRIEHRGYTFEARADVMWVMHNEDFAHSSHHRLVLVELEKERFLSGFMA